MTRSEPSSPLLEVPFARTAELYSDLAVQNGTLTCSEPVHLPGQPSISLQDSEVLAYLEKELATPKLNKMAPHMWLLATPSSDHISPLHVQIVRGRSIVISENPELHLVWIDDRVFLKPLPLYLLSRTFWEYYFVSTEVQRTRLAKAAMGYLRSYYYLIRHESDFRLATANHLIPANVAYYEFMTFISGCKDILDNQVSPRYHFGELRLSRLNMWSLPLLGTIRFHKTAWQYADIFVKYYAPYLFLFSILSVVLSAMQVGVGAKAEWSTFQSVSAWFSVVTLAFVCVVSLFFGLALLVLVGREIVYTVNLRFLARRWTRSSKGAIGKA